MLRGPMSLRVLVAEPGESAARVARTCHRLGGTVVALTTERDASGVHVSGTDEAVRVADLSATTVLEVAKSVGATHVHPGYGNLGRAIDLRRAATDDGPILVVSPLEALERVLDRPTVRALAEEDEIRFVTGTRAGFAKLADAIEAADSFGYPIRLRATRSGVVSSRRIDDEDQLFSAWDDLAREATDRGAALMVERELSRPRRVDVLLAAASDGEVVALTEAEIAVVEPSAGVVLEESPSPELTLRSDGESVRLSMFDSAIRFATRFGFVGLVSVRFFLDVDGHFHVAGVRTGLPRHHGTYELVTGVDLVELELALAGGGPLPESIHALQPAGHAFGASLRSPEASGHSVSELRVPPQPMRRARVDATVEPGDRVCLADGDLVLRLHAFATIRHASLLGLDRLLSEAHLDNDHRTNARSLRTVLADEAFRAGKYDATLAERLRYAR